MKWIAGFVVASMAAAAGTAQTPTTTPLPLVTSFTLPAVPQIFRTAKVAGSFKVLVTTDGRQVTAVREVDRPEVRNSPMLAPAVDSAVRAWRFAPHAAQSFELTVRAGSRQDSESCTDHNWRVTLHLPIEVALEYPPECLVHYSIESVPGTVTVQQVRGVVRDEADASPASGVNVTLRSTEVDHRTTVTDNDGTFDLGPVPPGKYSVGVGGLGYGHRSYIVVVKPNVSSFVPLAFVLHKYADYKPAQPTVRVEEVALYPLELREAGVAGDVRLQVEAGGQATVLDGPKGLADAALSNLKTWRWDNELTRGITVTYHYRLLPGDCIGDNGPFVSARYPLDVDISTKRPVPCGPGAR